MYAVKYDYIQSVFTPPKLLLYLSQYFLFVASFPPPSLPLPFLPFCDPLSPIIAVHVCMNVWLASGTLEINPESIRL